MIIIYDDLYKLFNSYLFVHYKDRKIDINKQKLINEMIEINLPDIDTIILYDDFGKVIKKIIINLSHKLNDCNIKNIFNLL